MADDAWNQIDGPDEAATEVTYFRNRRADRTYVSRSFRLNMPASPDHGQPARYVTKVFDNADPTAEVSETEELVIPVSPTGRVQLKLQVVRESGVIRKLRLEKLWETKGATSLKCILQLDREAAGKLIDLVRSLGDIPIEGDRSVRVDDDLIRDLFTDPDSVASLYCKNPHAFRRAIEDDASARDLIALAYRREQLDRFRRLLNDSDYFASEQHAIGKVGPERVWQDFLEENPWILGVSLAGQLLTSWSSDKLEQTVSGFSIDGSGKRTDALMRTAGRIRSMVFAEIKHHSTPLLEQKPYRADCWAASAELAGGITQIQQTVYRAVQDIGDRLGDVDDDGNDIPGEHTYLVRPRSFLIIGSLEEMCGSTGGINQAKNRSFELFRRNLHEPEVLTFDELLARAEWHVVAAERESVSD